jgi:hypothetical protein
LHRLYQLYDRRTIWDQFERAVRPIEGEPVIAPARKSRKAFNVLG